MRLQRFIIILFVMLTSTGCFTTSLLMDGPVPDDRTVRFHLTNGTLVVSTSGRHHRVEGGYHVAGLLRQGETSERKYEGVLLDGEIDHVTVQRFNAVGTIALVGGFAGLVVALVEVSKAMSISPWR